MTHRACSVLVNYVHFRSSDAERTGVDANTSFRVDVTIQLKTVVITHELMITMYSS